MQFLRKEILNTLYAKYKQGEIETLFDLKLNDYNTRDKYVPQFHYLQGKGYLEIIAELGKGGFVLKLTSKGIDYIENGFQDVKAEPIYGNNNIIVNGSNNNISNNYNNIINNIKNSDLSDENKQTIISLLNEIKHNNNKETTFTKVKSVISDIITKSVTSVGIDTLTTLFTELISNLK